MTNHSHNHGNNSHHSSTVTGHGAPSSPGRKFHLHQQHQQQEQPSVDPTSMDPQKQLRTAMESVVEAFERQSKLNQDEVNHWKQVCTQQRQQMLSMEAEIGALNRKLAQYDTALSRFQAEQKQLATAKSVLNEKYNLLRKNALQLDAFRKQIISMVEFSPVAISIPDAETSFLDATNSGAGNAGIQGGNMQNSTAVHGHPLYTSAVDQFNLNHPTMDGSFGKSSTLNQQSVSPNSAKNRFRKRNGNLTVQSISQAGTSTLNQLAENSGINLNDESFLVSDAADLAPDLETEMGLESLHLTPFHANQDIFGMEEKSAGMSPSKKRLLERHKMRKAASAAATSTDADKSIGNSASRKSPNKSAHRATSSLAGDVSVDAPTLYKQIREVLTAEEFDQFATQIANFNSGIQTAEETKDRLSRLIKVPNLVAQMKLLISRAITETGADASTANHSMGNGDESVNASVLVNTVNE